MKGIDGKTQTYTPYIALIRKRSSNKGDGKVLIVTREVQHFREPCYRMVVFVVL